MAYSSELRTITTVVRFVLAASIAAAVLTGVQASDPSEHGEEVTQSLAKRINAYHVLIRDSRYAEAYEMLGTQWRKGPKDKKKWVHSTKQMDNGIRILDWRLKSIDLAEDRAKVRIVLRVRTRESLFRWGEGMQEEDHFWVKEDGQWYYVPMKLDDWDETRAIRVPVPDEGKPPLRIEIKTKD